MTLKIAVIRVRFRYFGAKNKILSRNLVMSASKKTRKSKFSSNDMSELLNNSLFMSSKKGQKRQKIVSEETDKEKDISNITGMYQMDAKKKKVETAVDAKKTRQKLLEVLGNQMDARFGQYIYFLYYKSTFV